jgi:hypothetical protein
MKKSCKSANQEQLKNCEDLERPRMKIQEASGDLQEGGIMFPKFQGKLFEDEDLKRWKIGDLDPRNRCHAPRAWISQPICLVFYYAPKASYMGHSHAPRASKNMGRKRHFLLL